MIYVTIYLNILKCVDIMLRLKFEVRIEKIEFIKQLGWKRKLSNYF